MTNIKFGEIYTHENGRLYLPDSRLWIVIPPKYKGEFLCRDILVLDSYDKNTESTIYFHKPGDKLIDDWIDEPFEYKGYELQPFMERISKGDYIVRWVKQGPFQGLKCSFVADDYGFGIIINSSDMMAIIMLLSELCKHGTIKKERSPPKSNSIDEQLIGRWSHENYYSNGSFSCTTVRRIVFSPDGRFIKGSPEIFANLKHHNSTGDWTGTSHAESGLKPDSRGSWKTQGNQLRLDYDDNTYILYQYEVWSDGLELKYESDEVQFWSKF